MENKIENKRRLFDLYAGQKVFINYVLGNDTVILKREWIDLLADWNEDSIGLDEVLELIPLSKITHEDALAVINIYDRSSNKPRYQFQNKVSPFGEGFLQVYYIQESSCDNDDGYRVAANFSNFHINIIDNVKRDYRNLECYDYLRSKGYAIPFGVLSVNELIDYGWVVLRKEK